MASRNSGPHDINVRKFYDSFDPGTTAPSRLTFYKNLQKRFTGLRIPESAARLTFGCANPLTYLLEEIEYSREGLSGNYEILDAGGGAGFDSFILHQLLPNASITNCDVSPNLLSIGAAEFEKELGVKVNRHGSRVSFVCSDVRRLPVSGRRKFDFIVSNALLNLVDDKAGALSRMSELLGERGRVFISDVAFAGDAKPPESFYSHDIFEGTFFSPTIVSEREYSRLIFGSFGFRREFERHEIAPRITGLEELGFAISTSMLAAAPPADSSEFPCDCGGMIPVMAYQSVNVSESPRYLGMLLDETLNSATCPRCRRTFSDFIPFFFEWPEKSIFCHVFPASLASREAEFRAQVSMMPGHEKKPRLIFGQKKLRDLVLSAVTGAV